MLRRRGKGEGWVGRLELAKATIIYRINKVLLHNTGNYIQNSIRNHNGLEYLSMYLNHTAIEQSTILYINSTSIKLGGFFFKNSSLRSQTKREREAKL